MRARFKSPPSFQHIASASPRRKAKRSISGSPPLFASRRRACVLLLSTLLNQDTCHRRLLASRISAIRRGKIEGRQVVLIPGRQPRHARSRAKQIHDGLLAAQIRRRVDLSQGHHGDIVRQHAQRYAVGSTHVDDDDGPGHIMTDIGTEARPIPYPDRIGFVPSIWKEHVPVHSRGDFS